MFWLGHFVCRLTLVWDVSEANTCTICMSLALWSYLCDWPIDYLVGSWWGSSARTGSEEVWHPASEMSSWHHGWLHASCVCWPAEVCCVKVPWDCVLVSVCLSLLLACFVRRRWRVVGSRAQACQFAWLDSRLELFSESYSSGEEHPDCHCTCNWLVWHLCDDMPS